MSFEEQVKFPQDFETEVDEVECTADELELTKKLMEATTSDEFDIGKYKNQYNDKLQELIDAKIQGQEIVASPDEQPEQVINLLDALRASVAQVEGASGAKKKIAKSATKRAKASRKKTG